MTEYKTIKIPSLPVDEHKKALRTFFAQYPKDDIYFEIANKNLVINLRQLDLPDFKNNVKSAHSDSGFNLVLNTIVKNIEDVKSYGLKGSKRLYVAYSPSRYGKFGGDDEQLES